MVPAIRVDGSGWEGGAKCSHQCCFGERHWGREFIHLLIIYCNFFPISVPTLIMPKFSSVLLLHLLGFLPPRTSFLKAVLMTFHPSLPSTSTNQCYSELITAHTLPYINPVSGDRLYFWILDPWRWDQYVVPEHQQEIISTHCMIAQKREVIIFHVLCL